MLGSRWRFTFTITITPPPCFPSKHIYGSTTTTTTSGSGFYCRAAEDQQKAQLTSAALSERQNKKKVVIVGSGWAGLAAAHHLCKQGLDVTVLEGGYEFGPKNSTLTPDDVGIRGEIVLNFSTSLKFSCVREIFFFSLLSCEILVAH